jgi:hypothetical protein
MTDYTAEELQGKFDEIDRRLKMLEDRTSLTDQHLLRLIRQCLADSIERAAKEARHWAVYGTATRNREEKP